MSLIVERLAIPAVRLIKPRRFQDDRGFFCETWNKASFEKAGIALDFVQDNHALSVQPGTLRGLHFQIPPTPQDKLVRVTRGAILDVAVDIRHGSPTFGKWVAAELTAENFHQLLVPAGFAHAYCTLVPDTEVVYKVSGFYAPDCDRGLAFDDPQIGITWPAVVNPALLSAKDKVHPRLADLPPVFPYADFPDPKD